MFNVASPAIHTEEGMEAKLKAIAKSPQRVTLDALKANIAHAEYVKHVTKSGQVLRWAVLTCQNGFSVTGRPSASVDPANDNEEMGQKIAYDNAVNELWPLMGYALKEQAHNDAKLLADEDDFPLPGTACGLGGGTTCEACQ